MSTKTNLKITLSLRRLIISGNKYSRPKRLTMSIWFKFNLGNNQCTWDTQLRFLFHLYSHWFSNFKLLTLYKFWTHHKTQQSGCCCGETQVIQHQTQPIYRTRIICMQLYLRMQTRMTLQWYFPFWHSAHILSNC